MIEYIWQLPQNLLGLAVIRLGRGKYVGQHWVTAYPVGYFGVSLGKYIVFNDVEIPAGNWHLRHEQGHQKQSLYLGPLYLIAIGLPSLIGNIVHRIVGGKWYYKQPWESWANKLGGVTKDDCARYV